MGFPITGCLVCGKDAKDSKGRPLCKEHDDLPSLAGISGDCRCCGAQNTVVSVEDGFCTNPPGCHFTARAAREAARQAARVEPPAPAAPVQPPPPSEPEYEYVKLASGLVRRVPKGTAVQAVLPGLSGPSGKKVMP